MTWTLENKRKLAHAMGLEIDARDHCQTIPRTFLQLRDFEPERNAAHCLAVLRWLTKCGGTISLSRNGNGDAVLDSARIGNNFTGYEIEQAVSACALRIVEGELEKGAWG